MYNLTNAFKKFLKDESAQGATEYILLLVAIVAIMVLFKDKIYAQVQGLLNILEGKVSQATQIGP